MEKSGKRDCPWEKKKPLQHPKTAAFRGKWKEV